MPSPKTSRSLRIATRHSPLAMWQARHVAQQLAGQDVTSEIIPLASGGDTDMRPIDGSTQVGVFTKRIQEAVLNGEADVAVHSLKDLPTETDPRLLLAAVPPRESVRDCLLWSGGQMIDWIRDLPLGSRVGTGSRRRAAQLRARRPDLQVLPIRGNVQTRLEKLDAGDYDAIVLAEAGLLRLQLEDLPHLPLSTTVMLPAPGQGALGVEVRCDDEQAAELVTRLDDPATRAAVTAERTLLAALQGGCLAPIAALATVQRDAGRTEETVGQHPAETIGERPTATITLAAEVLSLDGSGRISAIRMAELTQPWQSIATQLGESVCQQLIEMGALELIRESRESG